MTTTAYAEPPELADVTVGTSSGATATSATLRDATLNVTAFSGAMVTSPLFQPVVSTLFVLSDWRAAGGVGATRCRPPACAPACLPACLLPTACLATPRRPASLKSSGSPPLPPTPAPWHPSTRSVRGRRLRRRLPGH